MMLLFLDLREESRPQPPPAAHMSPPKEPTAGSAGPAPSLQLPVGLFAPTNDEILANFIKVAFGREGGDVDETRKLHKWAEPIRIGLVGEAAGRFRRQVETHARHLAYLTGWDIEPVRGGKANMAVIFTDDIVDDILGKHRQVARSFFQSDEEMERIVGRHRGKSICYGAVAIRGGVIRGALVVIPPGRDKSTVWQCIVEEITQSLGLFADFDDISFSIFNDTSPWVDLTEQDQLMLRILYDRRLKSGMLAREARPIVRQILDELRPGS